MSGKILLIIIIGVLISTAIMNNAVNRNLPVDTLNTDYQRSIAYDIAASGVNIAANKSYFESTYSGVLYDSISFNGGKLYVKITNIGGDSAQILSQGVFPATGNNRQIARITYSLNKGYYDNYAVLTDEDNTIPWTTYDTAYGDLHSNNKIFFSRYGSSYSSAVFKGHVTAGEGFTYDNGADPDFAYDPVPGINIQLPASVDEKGAPQMDISGAADWNMKYTFNNGESMTTHKQVHLQFFVQGGVAKYRCFMDKRADNRGNGPSETGSNYGYYGTFKTSTDLIADVPANGIIYVNGADVFVEGTIKGKVSVVCKPDGSNNGGNIIVTNDLKCNTNPVNNPTSPDYIGLLAHKNVLIGNTKNNASNSAPWKFSVQATILALTGGLSAIDNASRDRRILSIFGSITQGYRKGVGSGSSTPGASGATGGFAKNYSYDKRLKITHANCVDPMKVWGLYAYLVRRWKG
jgi:hypothetical protein